MNKALSLALLAGVSSALLSLFIFGPAPLFAVGLVYGAAWASISAAIGALAVLAAAGGINTLSFLAITAIPSAIAVKMAHETAARGKAPDCGQILAAISVFGIAAIFFLIADILGMGTRIEAQIEQTFRDFFSQLQTTGDAAQARRAEIALDALARFASSISSGGLATASFLILVLNAVFVESILRQTGNSQLPRPRYSATLPPGWLSFLFLGAILLTFLLGIPGKLGLNAVIFLSFPFLLTGLAVIHTLSRRAGNPKAVLVGFYISLFVFGVIFGLFVAIGGFLAVIGAIEQWVGVRRRFGTRPPNDQEDE